jgi:hypothetical protein
MATLQDLIDQKAALEREISAVRNEGRAQALAKVVALMRESGLSIDDEREGPQTCACQISRPRDGVDVVRPRPQAALARGRHPGRQIPR